MGAGGGGSFINVSFNCILQFKVQEMLIIQKFDLQIVLDLLLF